MTAENKKSPGPIGIAFGTSLMDRVNVFFKVRRYVKMVAERWIILVLATVVGGGLAIYKAMNTQDFFEATSELGVAPKIQTHEDIKKAMVVEELNSFYDRQINYINSEDVKTATLKDMTDQMGDQKMIGNPPAFNRDAVRERNNNIQLKVICTDLDYAKKYVANWATEFLHYRDRLRSDLVSRSVRETQEEIKRYESELRVARTNLAAFQQTNQIYNAKTDADSLQKRLEARETELSDLKSQIEQFKGMDPITLANRIDGSAPRAADDKTDTSHPDRTTSGLTVERYEGSSLYPKLKRDLELKQGEYHRAEQMLLPKHPHMIKLAAQVDDLSQQVAVELRSLEERRKAKLQSMELQANTYPAIIKSLKDQLLGFRSLLITYDELKDRETAAMSQLASLQKKMDSLNVAPEEEATFTQLNSGESNGVPINVNRSRTIATGFLVGIAIGLGIIYTLGRLDDRLELAEEIEAELEEPVLGQVPLVDKKTINADRVMITRMDEHSLFSESIRGVRSAVMLGGSQSGPKQVMLVTSAVPGDGKTTFTVNFAVTLAIAGNRVLLVDADLRRGNIHGYFDLPRDPGYSELLQGELHWRDVVQKTEVRTMDLLSTGKLPPNPGELLISPINRQFVEEVRQAYDYIVFDCPPLTAIDDSFSLVGSSDGILFVVRSGQTSMRFAANALDSVRKRGAQVMGLVLNGITADNPYYYYKNYYHEYYNKGATKSGALGSTPLPSARMASPKVASIEDEAKVRSGQEHLVGTAVKENSKAEQFKAFRAAKRQTPPASIESKKPESES
jgi:succinoglycan biosynthesis transport protein ExoP